MAQTVRKATVSTRSDLDQRSIYVVEASTGRRAFEPAETGVETGKKGWYIDLNDPPDTGERVISAPLIYDNILIFSSIVPPLESTVNSCDAGGSGYVNALDAFSGTSLTEPFFDEIETIKDDAGNELADWLPAHRRGHADCAHHHRRPAGGRRFQWRHTYQHGRERARRQCHAASVVARIAQRPVTRNAFNEK